MGKTLRRLAVFLAAVVVLQGLALLFFTPAGLEKVFVAPLRLAGEKFRPDTNTYAVYYDARSDVAAADLIVVGMDFAVAESYDVLGHFTRFVKQNNDISDVLMPLTHNQVAIAGNMLKQTDEDQFNKRIRSLKEQTGMTDDCCDYLSEIFYVNSTMSEAKKFGVATYEDKDADTLPERIAAAFAETLEQGRRGDDQTALLLWQEAPCAAPAFAEGLKVYREIAYLRERNAMLCDFLRSALVRSDALSKPGKEADFRRLRETAAKKLALLHAGEERLRALTAFTKEFPRISPIQIARIA